jgi:filamentous hemagglutinin family protein
VTTSERAIIDWDSFSIRDQEVVRFFQPSTDSAVLNRVLGGAQSELLGNLSANGRVYLINPNGILIGADAFIDAGSFVASTLGVSEEDFVLARELHFQGDSQAAIVHLGKIHCPNGPVALLAHRIENSGAIAAPKGAVALVSGHEILLQPEGLAILAIRPDLPASGVENRGSIEGLSAQVEADGIYPLAVRQEKEGTIRLTSEGGKIWIRSNTGIYNEGLLQAPSGTIALVGSQERDGVPTYQLGTLDVSGSDGGEIDISSAKCLQTGELSARGVSGGHVALHLDGPYIETSSGTIDVSGTVAAGTIAVDAGNGSFFTSGQYRANGFNGGTIRLLGDRLTLAAADIQADGQNLGGEILIGGGFKGQDSTIRNATSTHINAATKISASGEGGRVVVWSNENTEHYGQIAANGNGSFIEVSGGELRIGGSTVAAQVLFDPTNFTVDAVNGVFPQYELIDPNAGGGLLFGDTVVALSTGNIVVTKPEDNFAAVDAGAVYLYNGLTAALISTITGSTASDMIGNSGASALTGNGNYVIRSPDWDNGAVVDAGAATWGSGTTGISGVVSAANSFVGSSMGDAVSSVVTTLLPSGNYVVNSPSWTNGVVTECGASTWGDGLTGQFGTGGYGAVSTANSIVGSTMFDQVGNAGQTTVLTNGNYVVGSSTWTNGVIAGAGAAALAIGTTGQFGAGGYGAISAANSLVGSTASDFIGSGGIVALNNGNFAISSPLWNNGATVDAGAATWGDGTTGQFGTGGYGAVSAANSFVGTTASDMISSRGIVALTNGNYVVRSPVWNNGATVDAGAATWGNGTNGQFGTGGYGAVSAANSIVGTTASDQVSERGVTALNNGNFVVGSDLWDNGAIVDAGAATWGNGTNGQLATGVYGAVAVANSFVGSAAGDRVSESGTAFGTGNGIFAMSSGDYLVRSSFWANGATTEAGAITWGSGTTGQFATGGYGAVAIGNSLVGSTTMDWVGDSFISELGTGNVVVVSRFWNNGVTADVGAITLVNGTNGQFAAGGYGAIGVGNSFVGNGATDKVGNGGIVALANGNFVVSSPEWSLGGPTDLGAVTWGDGTTGQFATGGYGAILPANSLVGSVASDLVGSDQVIELPGGDVVFASGSWDNGGVANAGAVTWMNGTNGQFATGGYGAVSAANSFVGSTATDRVGRGGIVVLPNGNYASHSQSWNNPIGGIVDAGAVSWGNGTNGEYMTGGFGAVSQQNSYVGQAASSGLGNVVPETVYETFIGNFVDEGSGRVRLGLGQGPNQITYARGQAQDMTIPPSILTATLNTGTSVSIQANNDVTITSAITVANPTGNGGDLSFAAGKSIAINADITTDNGSLTLIANDLLANGVVDAQRSAGAGGISVGAAVTIDTGTGNLLLDVRNGAGKTNSTEGDIDLGMGSSLLASGGGTITLNAPNTNINMADSAMIQSQDGDILAIAGIDFTAATGTIVQALGGGDVTLVVDNLFPTPPGIGLGLFDAAGLTVSSGSGAVRLFAGAFGISTFPAIINGCAYVPGAGSNELFATYYPSTSGSNCQVYYKTPLGAVFVAGFSDFIRAITEPFNEWYYFWFGGGTANAWGYVWDKDVLVGDIYPPIFTEKGLQLKPGYGREKIRFE